MKEHPILFKSPMVRAILEGRKTQTRRMVKPQLGFADNLGDGESLWNGEKAIKCPYGQPGDRLWVKETFLFRNNKQSVIYKADLDPVEAAGVGGMYGAWKPSIYMPRAASRITLDITNVRVQRLQDISEEDAKAEGIEGINPDLFAGPWKALAESSRGKAAHKIFRHLWDSINGERGCAWAGNPLVWAITFKRKE